VLRLIAALRPHHPASEGTVLVDGKPVERPGPDRSMVFQDYTSFDNRTVEDNVAFGLDAGACRRSGARASPRVESPSGAGRHAVTRRSIRASCQAACASASRLPER